MLALIVTVLTLAAMSAYAEGAFASYARLPMQWGATGRTNWSLPRRMALAATPLLALVLIGLVLIAGRAEAGTARAAWMIGLTFVGVHALYLAAVARAVSRR